MGKEVILNIIREVSKFDFVDYPNKKKAPEDTKFKIVFYKPPPKSKQIFQKNFKVFNITQVKMKRKKPLMKDIN